MTPEEEARLGDLQNRLAAVEDALGTAFDLIRSQGEMIGQIMERGNKNFRGIENALGEQRQQLGTLSSRLDALYRPEGEALQ